jgi:hypothetical protein
MREPEKVPAKCRLEKRSRAYFAVIALKKVSYGRELNQFK